MIGSEEIKEKYQQEKFLKSYYKYMQESLDAKCIIRGFCRKCKIVWYWKVRKGGLTGKICRICGGKLRRTIGHRKNFYAIKKYYEN